MQSSNQTAAGDEDSAYEVWRRIGNLSLEARKRHVQVTRF